MKTLRETIKTARSRVKYTAFIKAITKKSGIGEGNRLQKESQSKGRKNVLLRVPVATLHSRIYKFRVRDAREEIYTGH